MGDMFDVYIKNLSFFFCFVFFCFVFFCFVLCFFSQNTLVYIQEKAIFALGKSGIKATVWKYWINRNLDEVTPIHSQGYTHVNEQEKEKLQTKLDVSAKEKELKRHNHSNMYFFFIVSEN